MIEKLTISKKWNNPQISIRVSLAQEGGIELEMELSDFLSALKEEIGSVASILTRSKFSDKFDAAVNVVLKEVKSESSKIMVS